MLEALSTIISFLVSAICCIWAIAIGLVAIFAFVWLIGCMISGIFDPIKQKIEEKRLLIEKEENNQIKKYQRLCAELERKQAELEKTKADLKETQAELEQKMSALHLARKDGEPLFFGYPTLDEFYQSVKDDRFDRAVTQVKPKGKITVFCTFPATSDPDVDYYRTSLETCDCKDRKKRHVICKHMLFLAYHTGVLYLDKERYEAAKKAKDNRS